MHTLVLLLKLAVFSHVGEPCCQQLGSFHGWHSQLHISSADANTVSQCVLAVLLANGVQGADGGAASTSDFAGDFAGGRHIKTPRLSSLRHLRALRSCDSNGWRGMRLWPCTQNRLVCCS